MSLLSSPPSITDAVLTIENLNVWFELAPPRGQQPAIDLHVVRDVSLALRAGERFGLVGESGSGKTTTIQAVMGLLPPSARVSGRILLNGVDILAQGDRSVAPHRWRDIAMVFQGAMNAFNPVKTVGWQITEAMEIHGVASGPRAGLRVAELLHLVGISPDQAARYPHEFSGGMRQRAIIAMALSCNPKVLLADEPTTALDVMIQNQVLDLLVRLTTELDLAVILVTHDLGVVAENCHRAGVMLKGEMVEQGGLSDLYHRPQHGYTRRLFQATPSLAAVPMPDLAQPAPTSLLRIDDLHVAYAPTPSFADIIRRRRPPAKQAVRGISLTVARGELVALVGQSGCGKTTTLLTVLGMARAQSGRITFEGQDVTQLKGHAWRPLRRRMQMIYQDPYESLDLRFRVRDTIAEPLRIHGFGSNWAARERMVCDALERVGLSPASQFLNRFPHELSGGQRQRVAIAAGIILKPALLLADEPVSMLDVSVRTGVLGILQRLCQEDAMGILMITHDLSTAAEYADRIAVMCDGIIVEQGSAAEVIGRPRADYTKALIASVPNPDPDVRRMR